MKGIEEADLAARNAINGPNSEIISLSSIVDIQKIYK